MQSNDATDGRKLIVIVSIYLSNGFCLKGTHGTDWHMDIIIGG